MSAYTTERVQSVHHWNDTLFSFKLSRPRSFRFKNGHFVMVGLELDGKPLMRAYSIASPSHAEELEFLSIKVPNGPLTSKLQNLRVNDQVLLGAKAVGTLVLDDLKPGKNLYLLATGTGLAPFLSIVNDLEVYERFDKIVLAHCVRLKDDLAYREQLSKDIFEHEYLGPYAKVKLVYLPTCTREPFDRTGRITDWLDTGRLSKLAGLDPLCPTRDRFMVCGGPGVLTDVSAKLDSLGFFCSPRYGELGDYVVERAFVEK